MDAPTARPATRPAIARSGRKPRPHNTYPTAGDDNWIMITCTSDAEWEAFCEVSDHPHWRTDRRFATLPARLRHEDELDEQIGSWTAGQDGRALMQRCKPPTYPRAWSRTASTSSSAIRR